jgi:hypothetical protein
MEKLVGTLSITQFNGGVWAFARNTRTEAFFNRWLAEWERHGQRDQGALVRALYSDPLKILTLGNEWNYFPKYNDGVQVKAGIYHYPGDGRRWVGAIPGRIDGKQAWDAVQRFEAKRAR